MNALQAFLERGPERRAALENALAYYIPPELRGWLGLAEEINPVVSMERAGSSARAVADPNVQGWDKVAAVGDTASNMANALAPVVLGSSGAVPAANAVEEALMGWSASSPMAYAARDFVTDEFGGVGFGDEVASRGAQIMDMLRSGRGADVTDEMLDMGDPTLNARLNEWLFNNYDLPMDAASRAGRADALGMGGVPLYHGTKADVVAFDAARMGQNEASFHGKGVYSSAMPEYGQAYARGEGGNMIPVTARRTNEYVWPDANKNFKTNEGAQRFTEQASAAGYSGVRIPMMGDPNFEVVTFDPANIRSRFARFDPRLSHLRNLSAGLGGTVLMSDMFQQEEKEPRNALSGFLAERGL